MDENVFNQRLSQIRTRWSMIVQAHEGPPDAAAQAQRALMQRYGGAIYRYLVASLRNLDLADELAQEFAYRFLRGDFRRADPDRGRFRDFVKAAVLNLIVDHHRRQKTRPRPLPADTPEPATSSGAPEELDRQFAESWRNELLARAWEALARLQEDTGQPFHIVLRYRADHPDLRSAEMAEQLAAPLGRVVSADWIRQTLHRAREKFTDLLLDEVARSLPEPTREELEQELSELELLDYCAPALSRRDV